MKVIVLIKIKREIMDNMKVIIIMDIIEIKKMKEIIITII